MLKIPQPCLIYSKDIVIGGSGFVKIAYALHLSDRQVLDDVDTEMVVLPAVMGQNLPRETY